MNLLRWTLLPALALAAPAAALDVRELGERWSVERFVAAPAPCLRPADLVSELERLRREHPGLEIVEVARSVEGRPIHRITVGRGDREILLWSQMHGDEPSATPALLDLTHYLLEHGDDLEIARILERFTLRIVPMLNPDGAQVYRRRNAQGIDINRDARNLATPEGRLLKSLRDEHRPILGFNLHDQNRRRTVGDTERLATASVLAVVGDAAKTVTPGRRLSMRASVAIARILEAFIPGGVGRFDDTFSPRSFGDNLTAWGTPVVLIESGGVPPGTSLQELTRLNFVALVAVLSELAENDLERRDPGAYERIPENSSGLWADVALRGGRIVQPGVAEPFRADLAFDRPLSDLEREGCKVPGPPRSEIAELGDAGVFGAGRELDATGLVLLPPFVVGVDGGAARGWLDGVALDRLADLGVARLVWTVETSAVGAALEHAERMNGPRRPRLEVVTDRSDPPRLALRRAPESARSSTLGAAIERLERAAEREPAVAESFADRLGRLWNGRESSLRFEGAASFLGVKSQGGIEDLAAAPISMVVLDGLTIE